MPVILATRPNFYTGSPLDRASHRRDQTDWIDDALASPGSLWAPVWRGRNLLRHGHEAAFLSGEAAAAFRLEEGPWTFLGLLDERPLLAVDLSAVEDPATLLPPAAAFTDLRSVAATLPAVEAAVLAHARGMMHWRVRHRFCGNCGSRLAARSAGNVMHCSACETQHFPRTDPAVIMLVVRGDLALLAHSQRFPTSTMYSTLAGFVEPGESLEEAVAREVYEEAGVRVSRVTYHSSQPWPFPASLMVGFHAETVDECITIDGDELTDARWFSRAEIRAPDAHGFMIPRTDSIASRLIEDWLESA